MSQLGDDAAQRRAEKPGNQILREPMTSGRALTLKKQADRT
jgi:hypothetical protein